jgi:glutathione S-transferase
MSSSNPLTLYQFPISHYCEKVRWALDYKQLAYQTRAWLPGLHLKLAKKLSEQTSVPILQHGEQVVAHSAQIISYLDERFPEKLLTPVDPVLQQAALQWEQWADQQIGPHVRRVCYAPLLSRPDLLIPILSQQGPWYGGLLLKIGFKKFASQLRYFLKINPQSVEESRIILTASIERVNQERRGEFLLGNQFTRADIAVAALLAPLCMPKEYGVVWPEAEKVGEWMPEFAQQLQWLPGFYQRHRL